MTVHTILIDDASGSMYRLATDVRGAHNAYLDRLIAEANNEPVLVTLAVFNTQVTIIDNAVPVAAATRLDEGNYQPMGNTALLDAVGNTLKAFQANVIVEPGDKVFVFVSTDGAENSSIEHTRDSVRAIIAELEAKEWAFVFSGTGPDNWAEQGRSMGFAHSSTNRATKGGIAMAYAGRAETVSGFLRSDSATRSTFTSATVSGLIQDTIDKAGEGDPKS